MWYVIQTISGNEHEVCLWINTYVDKGYFQRCFVPLYEDVWKKDGIGNISIKKLFAGYIFLETDTPEKVYEELKKLSKLSVLLYAEDKYGKSFLPLHKEEEVFFDTILSDGIMKVSYVDINSSGKIGTVIGPLQSYQDNILRVDLSHRRAIVDIPILGENKRLKFGLWLNKDPKLDWIEEEKKNRIQQTSSDNTWPVNPWDWKAWKKLKEDKKNKISDEELYEYKIGDKVINTTGIYGDTPLEIIEVHPDKNTLTVNAYMFGSMVKVEMGMGEVEVSR